MNGLLAWKPKYLDISRLEVKLDKDNIVRELREQTVEFVRQNWRKSELRGLPVRQKQFLVVLLLPYMS